MEGKTRDGSKGFARIPILILMAVLMGTQIGTAQLDGLLRKTSRKLGNELERMAVEKLSDIIAKKAAQKMESAFDKMLDDAIQQDSTYQPDDSVYYRAGKSYSMFLQGMNDAADLPDSYHFDLSILMEITQKGDKPETIRMFYSKTEPIFAVQTATSEKESQIMLMDVGNDVTVMYQQDGDKKTAQALPNMMKLAQGMGRTDSLPLAKFEVSASKKKQKVAGYPCVKYIGTTDDDKFETWMTDKLGVDWQQAQGMLIAQFAPNAYDGEFNEMKGIALKSQQFDAKNGKFKSSMEAKEVDTNPFDLINGDYDFGTNR